ncbi:MAG: GAF domain-containing protein [Desulfovibrionaceae bacterium]|nr:GAF domain-containing protein [Desulfovibrionaceae bacterium]MBF0513779.1 GAF domain-containing protein [Desulfovibrionaceae bacterium]
MNSEKQLALLEAQIKSLQAEKESALLALGAAAGLGHFGTHYSKLPSPVPILAETAARMRDMIKLASVAVYLVDETTNDVVLSFFDGDGSGFDPDAEIAALIADQTFALALGLNRASFAAARDGSGQLLLHPLSTPARTRGMIVACLAQPRRTITDITLALFTVVANACAQALESFEHYRSIDAIRLGLEERIEKRTAELQEAFERLRVILDSVQAGVAVVDAATFKIMDINRAGQKMIGLTHSDIVGRTCFDCFSAAKAGDCPIVDRGLAESSDEHTIGQVNGGKISILKTAIAATIKGRPCIIECFVDVSEQHKLARLREDVERMTRHDLKSPLAAVIGLPEALLADASMSEDNKELLRTIHDAGVKMLTMINSSLDLYKMEAGTYKLKAVPVNVVSVLSSVIADLEDLAMSKRARVRIVREGAGDPGPPDAPFYLLGEELLFFSLFANLIKNALEASPKGGEVRIRLVPGRAAPIAPAPMALVAIANQGQVPQDMLGRFFDKYATSGKDGGTGLGTYSAKLIATNLGGEIEFTSDAQNGTEVLLRLPAPGDEESAP